MTSIINSISLGDLLVQQVPRENPKTKDFFVELLKNSEIEFDHCSKQNNSENNTHNHSDLTIDIEQLLQSPNVTILSPVIDFNTGFGERNDLHYETACSRPKLKTPLYLENYLNEFSTEEERAAARHALGLYNKGDVVAMSLLTAEDGIPSTPHLKEISVKLLRKGDVVFAPVTVFSAVFDTKGDSLEYKVLEIHTLINKQQSDIRKINDVSTSDTITSLGDVKLFLQGFNNGDHLNEILDDINQGVLRFENTGLILNKF